MNYKFFNNPEERFEISGKNVKFGINGEQKSNEEINEELAKKRREMQLLSLEKYMIIGSVVEIEGNFDKLMIIGYNSIDSDGKTKDYVACKYPEGMTKSLVFFNHDDIKKVYFVGFTTEYGNEYKSNLNEESKKKGMMI